MQKKKRSQWRKLDNAAQAFPAATGKKDTRVFRLYCELKEDVIEEVLQKAVECTLEKYPLYCSVLRKGLFWFYMEQRNLKPKVKAEDRPPCSGLYVPDQKSFLFEVSYYKKKINLEVFHCLTDGTGALNFLKELAVLFKIRLWQCQKEQTCIPAERGTAGAGGNVDSGDRSFFRRGIQKSEGIRGVRDGISLCRTALCDSRGDAEKSDEKAGYSDGAGESEKLFSLLFHDELFWLD